jgi:Outer membrane protein beta-barrel domain
MLRIGRALILVASIAAVPASAQGPGTKFGAVIGGATLSDMAGLAATSDSRWGGTAGLLIGYNAWRTATTLEANWVQKGGGDTRLDYIELPLTLGGVVPTGDGTMRGRLYTGLSVGFKISCSSDVVLCNTAEGTEFGWPFGIQFGRNTANGGFFGFDVRYTVALSDAFETGDIYNRPWQFRVMFGKRFGGS